MLARVMTVVAASAALFSCSNGNRGDAGSDGWTYTRPDAPPGAIVLETPEYTVGAGQEILYCTYTATTLEQSFDTRELHSYQAPGGHHAILFYTSAHQPPGAPHPCTDEEMTTLRLVGGGAESNEQAHAFTHLSHVYRQGCSIYSTFVFRASGSFEGDMERWRKLKGRVSATIVEHGGTISHQHGVGVDHAPYLPAEKGALGMDLIRAMAREFDPQGMMNPGKLFS